MIGNFSRGMSCVFNTTHLTGFLKLFSYTKNEDVYCTNSLYEDISDLTAFHPRSLY